MPFSQSAIVSINPPIQRPDGLFLSWKSTAPAGTWYQLYLDRSLAWFGRNSRHTIPPPRSDVRIDVGTVLPGEQATDFSYLLPAAPVDRAKITWIGGAFLDPSGGGDVAGFKVFGEPSPGAGVDMATPLATILAYTDGYHTDGYGMGGYGAGGYGSSGASYEWESDPLWSGTWAFAVAAYDREGDLGTVASASITIAVPPRPPGWRQAPPRLSYQVQGYGGGGYGSGGYGMPAVQLTWLPSPG